MRSRVVVKPRGSRCGGFVLGAAVALGCIATGLFGAGTAGAVTASASVVKSAAASPSARDLDLTLAGASQNWVLYNVYGRDSSTEQLRAQPVGGGKPVTVPGNSAVSINGDFLIYTHKTRKYLNLRTGATGSVPAAHKWRWASPDGGVYVADDATDNTVHAYEQNAATMAVTDLGTLPGFTDAQGFDAFSADVNENGVVFGGSGDDPNTYNAYYMTWDNPGHLTKLDTAGFGYDAECSLTTNAYGCANAFSGNKLPYTSSQIVRIPLDGSAPQAPVDVTLPKVSEKAHPYVVPVLTSTRTGWVFYLDPDDNYDGRIPTFRLHSVPADKPDAPKQASSFIIPFGLGYGAIAHGGDKIYVVHRTAFGIYTVSPDDKTQKLLTRVRS